MAIGFSNVYDLDSAAKEVIDRVKNIRSQAQVSESLDYTPQSLAQLYYACVSFLNLVTTILSSGLSVDDLGAQIETRTNGFIVWATAKPDFVALRNTDIPNFNNAVVANESIVLAQTFGPNSVIYVGLSQGAKNVVGPLITAIINRIG